MLGQVARFFRRLRNNRISAREIDPDQIFLGFGFEWQPVHSQRLYELAKINYRDVMVSPRLLHLLGYEVNPQPDAEIGMPYIHGVEPREHALYRPLQNFEGGTVLSAPRNPARAWRWAH